MGKDRYNRTLAQCRVGQDDIGGWMVQRGHALAYRRYSRGYVADEEAARLAKLGVWQGSFTKPWDWRRGRK